VKLSELGAMGTPETALPSQLALNSPACKAVYTGSIPVGAFA
jgi:hypothetical protein